MDIENELIVTEKRGKGEGEGVRWMRSLGLTDADYCL